MSVDRETGEECGINKKVLNSALNGVNAQHMGAAKYTFIRQ